MGGERPPAASRFLARAAASGVQAARVMLEREEGDDEQDGEDNHEAGDQRAADGELEVEDPEIVPEVVADSKAAEAEPDVSAPPLPHPVPRPRAKGVRHPPVPTKSQIEKHALEQHVNYAPWCAYCLQASALMKQHPLVAGTSPNTPTVSADFCFS